MIALVAGGAGFIGSHLCMRLLREGHDVYALDNFVTSKPANTEQCYLLARELGRYFCHLDFDVTKISGIWSEKLDLIFHLASAASPKWYSKNPIETIKSNIMGSFNLLELGKRYKSKVFLASTSEIYGDPMVHPQVETYWGNVNTVGPRSNYDESKRCAETIFHEYYKQYGIDIKIARIFNTYGPNMTLDDGRVVSNFIVNALQGKDLVIHGDGNRTRSFTYVDDLVDGIIKLCDSKENTPVNLGNPTEFKIIELAELVLKKTRSPSKIVYSAEIQDEPTIRRPDITKARTLLGWEPKLSLEDGLDKCIPYFQEALKSNAT